MAAYGLNMRVAFAAFLILGAGVGPAVAQDLKIDARPLKAAPGDDELQKLLKERYNAQLAAVVELLRELHNGRITEKELLSPVREWMRASLELSAPPEEKLALLAHVVQTSASLESSAKIKHQVGQVPLKNVHLARVLALEVQIEVAKLKKAAGKEKKK